MISVVWLIPIGFALVALPMVAFCAGLVYGQMIVDKEGN